MRRAALGAALLAAALVGACGGGDRVLTFAPTRVLAFGDETSVIEDVNNNGNGRKYSVNALNADQVTLDCKSNPVWVQYVALGFGLVFPQCNPAPAVVAPTSRIYAAPGAKVADIATQIDQHLAGGGSFGGTDLATVLAGANDLLSLYTQYPTATEDELTAQAEAAGTALADQVNRIANAGGKVVVSTVPDLGLTPYGIKQELANAGRSGLLTRLSARFNAKLRVGVINDGRRIGLMFADESLQAAYRFPSQSGFSNVTEAVCDPAKAVLPDCTTLTLVANGSGLSYLWADDLHLSAGGQSLLGQLALSRAINNPF